MIIEPLELKTCTLRRLAAEDAAPIAKLANNPQISRLMRNQFPYPYRLADAEGFIEFSNAETSRGIHLAIEVDGLAVGVVGLAPGESGEVHARTAEIGYWVGEPYWGRGIASEAARALTDLVFEAGDLLRVFATVFDGNPASCRVLEKAGYTKEGIMRAHVEKSGKILDAHLYAKLNPTLGDSLN